MTDVLPKDEENDESSVTIKLTGTIFIMIQSIGIELNLCYTIHGVVKMKMC